VRAVSVWLCLFEHLFSQGPLWVLPRLSTWISLIIVIPLNSSSGTWHRSTAPVQLIPRHSIEHCEIIDADGSYQRAVHYILKKKTVHCGLSFVFWFREHLNCRLAKSTDPVVRCQALKYHLVPLFGFRITFSMFLFSLNRYRVTCIISHWNYIRARILWRSERRPPIERSTFVFRVLSVISTTPKSCPIFNSRQIHKSNLLSGV
jgi:hypothetical protein